MYGGPFTWKRPSETSLESACKFRAKNAEGALTSDTIESISTASMFPFARVFPSLSFPLARYSSPRGASIIRKFGSRCINPSEIPLEKWKRRGIIYRSLDTPRNLFALRKMNPPPRVSFSRRLILYYVGADETTGVEQQSHHAQPDVREARTEAVTPEAKENRDPGLDFGIAQMPRRLPTQEMHPFKRLPGWRRCHVAEDCRQKPAASGLAGESFEIQFNFFNNFISIERVCRGYLTLIGQNDQFIILLAIRNFMDGI